VTARFLDVRKDGPNFTGEIRFHNLRPVELGALVWAIIWGDPTGNGRHRHMLGRAKAFGHGQISARIVSSRIEPNAGGDAPALQDLVKRFTDWTVAGWTAAKSAEAPAGFDGLPPIRDLLAIADPDLGRRLDRHLTFPQAPQGKDEAERTVKGYQALKIAINKAYAASDPPAPDHFTLPPYPTD
jgi:hypothetical protein